MTTSNLLKSNNNSKFIHTFRKTLTHAPSVSDDALSTLMYEYRKSEPNKNLKFYFIGVQITDGKIVLSYFCSENLNDLFDQIYKTNMLDIVRYIDDEFSGDFDLPENNPSYAFPQDHLCKILQRYHEYDKIFIHDVDSYERRAPLYEVISVSEAAEIANVSERTIKDRCISGIYEARKIGNMWLILKASVFNNE